MAYETSNPPTCMVPRMGAGPAIWMYVDADPHATVDTAGYFTDGAELGLVANDMMIVLDEGAGCTVHAVTDATTISAGMFS